MSKIINVYEAKTQLSKLLDQVAKGEEIRIGKYGKPIARLVPDKPKFKKRTLGKLNGKGYWMSDDFNDTPPEVLEAMDQTLDEDTA